MAGRPTKLTPEISKKIVDAIRLGATYELAANYGGISYEAFNNWMKKGAKGKEPEFVQLLQDVKKAEGAATVGWLAKIETAANDGAWQAAAWKLERRYPHAYGRQVTEVTGKDGKDLPAVSNVIFYIPKNGREDNDPPPGGATN